MFRCWKHNYTSVLQLIEAQRRCTEAERQEMCSWETCSFFFIIITQHATATLLEVLLWSTPSVSAFISHRVPPYNGKYFSVNVRKKPKRSGQGKKNPIYLERRKCVYFDIVIWIQLRDYLYGSSEYLGAFDSSVSSKSLWSTGLLEVYALWLCTPSGPPLIVETRVNSRCEGGLSPGSVCCTYCIWCVGGV